ncbi:MAG: nucleotidyltransferase domain-containing protein [Nanoarchaeota archaeon]
MIIPENWKMLTKEYTLLEPFAKEAWKKFTFKEVKKLSRNKSDNYVHTSLKRFVTSGILQEQKVGNNLTYSLIKNISSLNTIGFVVEYHANRAKHLPHKNIQKIINKLKIAFYVFIVTGSYAKAKQKETSDLDVVIICDSKQEPNAIVSQIKLESELMIPEVHPYVFTQEQFYQMLTTKEENYGKEIARNNLIITGGKAYYLILIEAIEHGFNG